MIASEPSPHRASVLQHRVMRVCVVAGISGSARITAFQPFFLTFRVPYSVTRNEELIFPVAIYSYLDECFEVMTVSRDIRSDISHTDTLSFSPGNFPQLRWQQNQQSFKLFLSSDSPYSAAGGSHGGHGSLRASCGRGEHRVLHVRPGNQDH